MKIRSVLAVAFGIAARGVRRSSPARTRCRWLAWVSALLCVGVACGRVTTGDPSSRQAGFVPNAPVGAAPVAPATQVVAPAVRPDLDPLLASLHNLFDEHTTVSTALHYLRLGDVIPPDDERKSRALDIVLGRGRFAGSLIRTRTGIRYHDPNGGKRSRAGGEAHMDQALAGLGALGIDPATEMTIGSRTYSVRDLVEDVEGNYWPKRREIEWTAMALTHYRMPHRSWRNRYGEEHTFDGLGRELIVQLDKPHACGNLHVLEALVALEKADREHRVLGPEVRAEVEGALRDRVARAVANQAAGGYWWPSWQSRVPDPSLETAEDRGDFVHITGHMLELLVELDPEFGPPAEVTERAEKWLAAAVLQMAARDQIDASMICTATHCYRALCLSAVGQRGSRRRSCSVPQMR